MEYLAELRDWITLLVMLALLLVQGGRWSKSVEPKRVNGDSAMSVNGAAGLVNTQDIIRLAAGLESVKVQLLNASKEMSALTGRLIERDCEIRATYVTIPECHTRHGIG